IGSPSVQPSLANRARLASGSSATVMRSATATAPGRFAAAATCSPAVAYAPVSVAISTIAAITGSARPRMSRCGTLTIGCRTYRAGRLAWPRLVVTIPYSVRNSSVTTVAVGTPRFSSSMLSWTLHDVHDPQSAIPLITRSHSRAAASSISSGMGSAAAFLSYRIVLDTPCALLSSSSTRSRNGRVPDFELLRRPTTRPSSVGTRFANGTAFPATPATGASNSIVAISEHLSFQRRSGRSLLTASRGSPQPLTAAGGSQIITPLRDVTPGSTHDGESRERRHVHAAHHSAELPPDHRSRGHLGRPCRRAPRRGTRGQADQLCRLGFQAGHGPGLRQLLQPEAQRPGEVRGHSVGPVPSDDGDSRLRRRDLRRHVLRPQLPAA